MCHHGSREGRSNRAVMIIILLTAYVIQMLLSGDESTNGISTQLLLSWKCTSNVVSLEMYIYYQEEDKCE